jgi:aryl-alcohol dehydrogenase-like predicted oxidoreductase
VEEHPLSRVGLGTWAFGGVGWGQQDDRDSIAAIHRAVELGVNWIDTAAIYGDGHSETIVGQALHKVPAAQRPLIFTKVGIRIDQTSGKTYRDLSPRSIRLECNESLKRLGVDQIDLYQIHWPVDETSILEQAWHTLAELRTEGKIRWAGVSNFSVTLLERCAYLHPPDAVQVPLSLINREAMENIIPWCVSHTVPVLTYSPLESGLLTGRFSRKRLDALPADDWRRQRPLFKPPFLERALLLVELIRPVAEDLNISIPELAIAWCLHCPGVTGTIVGARSSEQVNSWIDAQTVTLDNHNLDLIDQAFHKSQATSN